MANGNSSQLDHALGSITRRYLLHSRWRCIPSVLLLSSGCYLITHLWDATNSTYICPIVVGEANIIPAMQVLALFLDAFMAIILLELLQALQKTSGQNYTKFSLVVASVLFVVSLIWCLIGIILYFAKPWERRWLVPHELIFRPSFLLKVIVQSTVLSAAFITTLSSVSAVPLWALFSNYLGFAIRPASDGFKFNSCMLPNSGGNIPMVFRWGLLGGIIFCENCLICACISGMVFVSICTSALQPSASLVTTSLGLTFCSVPTLNLPRLA